MWNYIPLELIREVVATTLLYTAAVVLNLLTVLRLLFMRLKVGPSYFHVKPRPTPPATLNDPKWGTHSYITLKMQGIKLHYVEAGDRNNPLMLCLHGFPECWFSWRHQLAEFSSKYWVVAVDLRGYGASDKPHRWSDYQTDKLVEDIRQLIVELGKDKCILMAHDWGAVLGWFLVTRFPEMFTQHISLNGPHKGAYNKYFQRSPMQVLRSWYIYFFQLPWIPEITLRTEDLKMFNELFRGKGNNVEAFPDEVIEAYKYYFSQKGAMSPPLNYYRNLNFGAPPKKYPKVKVPSLIIWGVNDVALGKELAVMNAEQCEKAEVKYVENATHWVQQDQPEYTNKLIWEYLGVK